MIKPLKMSDVADYCRQSLGAVLHNGDAEFFTVNTDTRTLATGELFVALRGERFDAHDFLFQAAQKNVCGVVVEKLDENLSLPQLVVTDALAALGQIAAMNRNAFKKPVLAITGSNGKTTVKTMLADILRECGDVHATKGNLNNHIGVPLTLLELNENHDYAVIEMGASAIGEIAYLCSLARPQITMVNNVMPAHIEGFGSIEGVAQAKGEIYEQLSENNTAVVNVDDKFSSQWLNKITSAVVTVALNNSQANCHAKNIQCSENSTAFTLVFNGKEIAVSINALGEHSVRNALMSAAMASAAGASLQQIQQGLSNFSPVGGRMSRHTGVNQSLVIDDSYNANPGSVRVAMDVLASREGQRILVLGDLAELGENAAQLHAELGTYAQEKKLDYLFTLGVLSRNASDAFTKTGAFSDIAPKHHFTDRELLINQLKELASPTTTILIKGSRSAKMDLVVKALCHSGESH